MDAFEELFKVGKEPKTEKEMVRAFIKVQVMTQTLKKEIKAFNMPKDQEEFRALEACENQHTELMKCYQQRWFPECSKQQVEFWKCYKQMNIKLRKKHNVYF